MYIFTLNSYAATVNNSRNIRAAPVPVAVRSKAYIFGRSPAEIVGSNPTQGMDICLLWVLCVVR